MELGPRDRLSQAFVHEQKKGRTLEGPYGAIVNLDLRHLGEHVIKAKLPFVRELCKLYENIDPVTQMIPVRPVVHYMMGGVDTDINGATPMPGLYAAGEVACVSINGANRLGSNSLPELLVFGARAGKAAAEYAAEQRPPGRHLLAQAMDEEARLRKDFLDKQGGRESIAVLREEMQKIMENSAGIYRSAETLSGAAGKLRELRERFKDIRLDDQGHMFNTELISALELECMLEVAETMAECAMQRTESRGAHQRTDYPQRDDEKFLAHSVVRRDADGRARVSYRPVTITRWAPAERVYGR
jgi:fumarate reductase flavoprotein subunit